MAAALALALGTTSHPGKVLRPLAAPIAFLVCAVPLAVLLDRLGFFTAAAELLRHGRHLVLGLWVLAALVTTILNLDAAVVLLTPLYVRIAWRCGLDPLALAFQPVLLSCVASSALPVSNLTNLIAASARHFRATAFLATSVRRRWRRRWSAGSPTRLPFILASRPRRNPARSTDMPSWSVAPWCRRCLSAS